MFVLDIGNGIFIGDRTGAMSESSLKENQIVSMLTVENEPLPETITSSLAYKFVPIQDLEESDLLEILDECLDFLRNSPKPVLIHCVGGYSRCVAIAIAYFMKYVEVDKTVDDVLNSIKNVHPSAEPNAGFLVQLHLYKSMNSSLDKTNKHYSAWKYWQLYVTEGPSSAGAQLQDIGSACCIKCKRCRTSLSDYDKVFVHKCTHAVFVLPHSWMDLTKPKLLCRKCGTNVGKFEILGGDCACGEFLRPCFLLYLSKVDIPVMVVNR